MAGLEKIVTDELVFGVAERLTAAGAKVSNRSIWSEIGGGSMTTIAAALRRWRERQALKAEEPAQRMPLPEPVGEAMRDAVDRLWMAAQLETQKEIERLTQAMNERLAEVTAERDEALAELQATVEELQTAKARGDTLQERVVGATDRAATAERQAHELETDLARARADAETERQRLSSTEAERESLRQSAAAAREDAARLAGQVEAMTVQHAELLRVLVAAGVGPGVALGAGQSAGQSATAADDDKKLPGGT